MAKRRPGSVKERRRRKEKRSKKEQDKRRKKEEKSKKAKKKAKTSSSSTSSTSLSSGVDETSSSEDDRNGSRLRRALKGTVRQGQSISAQLKQTAAADGGTPAAASPAAATPAAPWQVLHKGFLQSPASHEADGPPGPGVNIIELTLLLRRSCPRACHLEAEPMQCSEATGLTPWQSDGRAASRRGGGARRSGARRSRTSAARRKKRARRPRRRRRPQRHPRLQFLGSGGDVLKRGRPEWVQVEEGVEKDGPPGPEHFGAAQADCCC